MTNIRKTTPSRGAAIRNESLGSFDWWLISATLLLLGLGLMMVLSSGGIVSERLVGDKYFFFKRQLFFACVGCVALWICASLPRNFLHKLQYPALVAVLLLLVITLSPLGSKVNGAQRWIAFPGFSVQPLEFAKIALALYLAYFMSTKKDLVRTFNKGVLPPFAVTLFMCFLLLQQPDFGGAVVLGMILFFMCLMGGTRFTYLFVAIGIGVAGAIALIIHSPYRFRRLTAFIDPFKDAQDAGYQLVQSYYALGSGGLFGVGLGGSVQKMFYLPEAHTDFIMSVVGEEMGFIGITLVMGLFALFFMRCHRIITGLTDLRDRFTAFGLALVIALGAILNMAVVMGVAPPKGVAMPFLSYGGSSLLATMICVGLLLNLSRSVK